MKNPLKEGGNRYEIHNEIPKIQEWKIHWMCQRIDMKFQWNILMYGNEISIEIPKPSEWNKQWNFLDHKNEKYNENDKEPIWNLQWDSLGHLMKGSQNLMKGKGNSNEMAGYWNEMKI